METNRTTEDLREQTEAYKVVEKIAKQTNFIKYRDSEVESFRSLYIQICKDCEDLVYKARSQKKADEEIMKMVEVRMRRHS